MPAPPSATGDGTYKWKEREWNPNPNSTSPRLGWGAWAVSEALHRTGSHPPAWHSSLAPNAQGRRCQYDLNPDRELLPVDAVTDAARMASRGVGMGRRQTGSRRSRQGIKVVRGRRLRPSGWQGSTPRRRRRPSILTPSAPVVEIRGYPFDLVGRIDIQEAMVSRYQTSGKLPARIAPRSPSSSKPTPSPSAG